jgi:hypothetical protein
MKKKLLKWLGIEVTNDNLVNLDAFSSSQVGSKIWLCDRLEQTLASIEPPVAGYKIWIYGGWYGITNLFLRVRERVPIEFVRSIDRDPSCEYIADKINKFWEWQGWQFKAQTGDVNTVSFTRDNPHIVINTSVEHMGPGPWYDMIPAGTIVVLQASDLPHDDHTAVVRDLEEFKTLFPMTETLYEGKMTFNYPTGDMSRFMLIGKR